MATTVKTLRARLVADVSDFNKKMDKAAKKVDAVANRLKSAGTRLTLGITVPLVALGLNAVKTAAKFDILERKFAAVFGNTAKETKKFSKELAGATGRSAIKVRELLSGTQDLLTGFGVTTEKATELSQQFNTLALDVASFQNASDDQVIKAFNSAITGETEALKTLGIKISQADINQRLLNDGIKGGIKEATAAQKAQAILGLITGQTANAQGKAAEFANTMAGRLRALTAKALDLRVELGNRLLPVAEKIVGFFEKMLKRIDKLDEATKNQAIRFGILAALIGPAVLGLGLMLKVVSPLIFGFTKLAGAVVALGRAFILRLLPAMVPILIPLAAIAAVVAVIVTAFAVAKKSVGLSLGQMGAAVKIFVADARKFFEKILGKVITAITGLITGLIDKVRKFFGVIAKFDPTGVFAKLEKALEELPAKAKLAAQFLGEDIKEGIGKFTEKTKEVAGETKDAVVELFTEMKDLLGPVFEKMFGKFKEQLLLMAEAAGIDIPKIQKILNTLSIPPLGGGAGPAAGATTDEGKDTGAKKPGAPTGGIFSGVSDFFKNLTKDVNLTTVATDLATDSITAFADGIADAIVSGEDFGDKMRQVFKEVLKAVIKLIVQLLVMQAISGGGAGFASLLSNVFKSSGKQSGGRIPAGGFAPVGEAGTELAAGPAQIIPFSKLGGGGGVNIIINNESSAEISSERTTSEDGAEEIKLLVQNIISEDFSRGGPSARAIQNSFAGVRTRVTG